MAHMMGVTVAASKGKWIPGTITRETQGQNSYLCECCDRRFTKKTYLDKHLTTELHFKRAAHAVRHLADDDNDDDRAEDFDQSLHLELRRSGRQGKGEKYKLKLINAGHGQESRVANSQEDGAGARKPVVTSTSEKRSLTHTCCPTCHSKVDKKQMGKHLISHFHCQRSRNSRLANLERKLILEHIHDIVIQSPYQCATCRFYFTQKEHLLTHVIQRHTNPDSSSQKKWNCSACSRTKFASNGHKLLEHLQSSSHKIVESVIAKSIPIIIQEMCPHSCPVTGCHKMFILNRELASHVVAHHGSEFVKLLHIFNSPAMAKADKDPEAPKDNIIYVPENQSSPEFESTRSLKTRRPRLMIKSGPYSCPSCDYTTRKKSHFTRHSRIHDGESRTKDFLCSVCPSSFYEQSALTLHQKIHTGKTVNCLVPDCSWVGRNNSELKSHFVVHNLPGSYSCNLGQCKYSTKSKRHLVRHELLVHNIDPDKKTRPEDAQSVKSVFPCPECMFKTNTANGLKRHMLQHTQESPYHCPYCDFKAKNIENLRTHVLKRQVHAGKCLYRCSICVDQKSSIHKKKHVFTTNKFIDFRRHIEQSHANQCTPLLQKDIFVIAGIFKPHHESGGPSNNSEFSETKAQDNSSQEIIQLEEQTDFEMESASAIFVSLDHEYPLNQNFDICNSVDTPTHYVLLEQPSELGTSF